MIKTGDDAAKNMVSQSRWDNTRSCIFWIAENLLLHKSFEREKEYIWLLIVVGIIEMKNGGISNLGRRIKMRR